MRILIADDELLFADMLEAYLARLNDVTIDKASSLEAVASRAQRGERYDIVILGAETLGMYRLDGLTRARRYFPQTPIAFLSDNTDPQIVRDAFRLGADGFIPKRSTRGNTMLNALRLMLTGDRYIPSMIIPDVGRSDKAAERKSQLSPREVEVVLLVKAGHSNKNIAAQIGISPVTVALHLRRVFKKIGARNRTDAVRIITERGLLGNQ